LLSKISDRKKENNEEVPCKRSPPPKAYDSQAFLIKLEAKS